MAKQLKIDPAWDSSSSTVRCSSTGEDASKYHDLSEVRFESNGRTLDSILPGRFGLKGAVIPRATPRGGSLGFDPHKPRLVTIDPDIEGQSCVVDLSLVTPAAMDKAMKEASANQLLAGKLDLIAAQAFHNLAAQMEVQTAKKEPQENKMLISPAVSPKVSQAKSEITVQTEQPQLVQHSHLPTIKVIFEMPNWGSFETNYHSVILTDCILVLCWDCNCVVGAKFFPPVADAPLTVKIDKNVFNVFSYGSKFQHNNFEYCILVLND